MLRNILRLSAVVVLFAVTTSLLLNALTASSREGRGQHVYPVPHRTMLSSLFGWFGRPAATQSFCATSFPEMWSNFLDHFQDVAYTGVCNATRAPHSQVSEVPTTLPAVPRLVAIGDLHGDYGKMQRAFKLAGLVDDKGHWAGGATVVVQVGDILDRGDQELQILYYLERLQQEAERAGGRLHILNGNHETMNVMGYHRYATSGANDEMVRWLRWHQAAENLRKRCDCSDPYSSAISGLQGVPSHYRRHHHDQRGMILKPGSHIPARFFAGHPTVLQIGSSVFVHGGILPEHVRYGLERINKETQQWLLNRDEGAEPPAFLRGSSAVVWARDYSLPDERRCDCDTLQQVLQSIPGASRMVVGHTIQEGGISSACGERVFRVDVGMSQGCGDGEVEVLEILDDAVIRRLREGVPPEPMVQPASTAAAAAGQQQRQAMGT